MKKIQMKVMIMVMVFTGGQIFAQAAGGKYAVDGINPDGSSYKGICKITEESGQYKFKWKVGASKYEGTGTLEGTTMTVDWGQDAPVIYEVSPDGTTLTGTWAGGTGSETLTKQ